MDSATPTPTTVPPMDAVVTTSVSTNTSGMGDTSVVPEEIKGWSWGGFWLTWIWSIGNSIWIGLISLIPIPIVSFIMAVVLGIKGREWAWRNKKWESIETFKKTQHKWAIWGFVTNAIAILILIACVALIFLSVRIPSFKTSGPVQEGPRDLTINMDNIVSSPLSSPTSASVQTNAPTSKPTAPAAAPTNTPSSKFASTGTQTLENGVTTVVSSASMSGNTVTISITFKNTSATSQNANLVRVQMHDETLGTGIKENYAYAPLSPGESRTFSLSFDALPKPPFKFQYAKADGVLVTLGTYTP